MKSPPLLVTAGFALVLSIGLHARGARADCPTPAYCVCSPEGTTFLDAAIEPGTSPDTVRLQVEQVHGEPLDIPEDGMIELPRSYQDVVRGDDIDKRALVHVLGGEVIAVVLIDEDGNLDCKDVNSLSVEEAIEIMVLGGEECGDAIREREGVSATCDDDDGCSVGRGSQPWALMLLALVGLVRRRYRSRARLTG